MRLSEKVAFVTGGTSGIGRSIALLFAKEGAKVCIAARREEEGAQVVKEIREAGGSAIFVQTDVTRAHDCAKAVAATVEAFGKLDIAVNNAGTETYGKSLVETDEAAWDSVLGVNLKGAFLSMKYELPEMIKGGGGSIINISSVFGLVGSTFGCSPYHASKHGLIGLTRAAALEYAKQNIRVNALCPGLVLTEMTERWFADTGVGDQVRAMHPLGRVASVDETAEVVLFLCTDVSSFITGVALPLDGGYSAG
jgi:NAD(P)-dependent dehydrogenase (short-subunit alcohol dehydrogenase family)